MGRLRTELAQRIPYPLWRLGWNRVLPRLRHLHRAVQQFHCLRRLGSHPYPRRLAGKPVRDSPGYLACGYPRAVGNRLWPGLSAGDSAHARIRNWKHLTLYAPTEPFAVEHIEHLRELCRDTVDWTLIKTHIPDMLRVAISISQGKVRSSTILRKLGTESRKNKLYVAFRELGRVVRTMFLLRFMNDDELRRTINAATNIAEAWNGLIQWVAFGGDGVIRQNNREEQRKIIRYNHLVANLVVFHNVVSMTRVLQALIDEGYPVTPEIIARLAPYKIGHINRFGHYDLHFDQPPPPIIEELRLAPVLAVS